MNIGIYVSSVDESIGLIASAAILAEALSAHNATEIIHHRRSTEPGAYSAITERKLSRVRFREAKEPPQFTTDPVHPDRRYEALRNWSHEVTCPYDLVITLTDRVPIYCSASRGILVISTPYGFLPQIYRQFWVDQIASYQLTLATSYYTQFWTRALWDTDCAVVHPPVNRPQTSVTKEKLVLAIQPFRVSRTETLQLLSAFDKVRSTLPDWSFTIAGKSGTSNSDRKFLESVREAADKVEVKICADLSAVELNSLCDKASCFWHMDLANDAYFNQGPDTQEGFSFPMVRAMATGAVPVVSNTGAFAEVIRHGESGLFANSVEELADRTVSLIRDETRFQEMAGKARERAACFQSELFIAAFLKQVQQTFGVRPPLAMSPARLWKRIVISASEWLALPR
jgi:glycosyltransferase involved in cell wall biosynthesis